MGFKCNLGGIRHCTTRLGILQNAITAEDLKDQAAERVPDHGVQDKQMVNEMGGNAGYEAARDMSEKIEDV